MWYSCITSCIDSYSLFLMMHRDLLPICSFQWLYLPFTESLLRDYWEMDRTPSSRLLIYEEILRKELEIVSLPHGLVWYMCIWVLSKWVSTSFFFFFFFFIQRCITRIFVLILMQLSKFFNIMSRLENSVLANSQCRFKKAGEKYIEYACLIYIKAVVALMDYWGLS